MEIAKEAMKGQFDKKRQNPQRLKKENNVWLEAKKIHSQRSQTRKDTDSLEF